MKGKKETPTKANGEEGKSLFRRHRGYFLGLIVLIILTLASGTRNADGTWELSLGVREITLALAFLFILPFLPVFFEALKNWTFKTPFFEFSAESKQRVDEDLAKNVTTYMEAGEAPKKNRELPPELVTKERDIDEQLAKKMDLLANPIVQQVYFQELLDLAKEFNRNRRTRELAISEGEKKRIVAEGDRLAYRMRSLAPLLPTDFDVIGSLRNPNLGMRLAAAKYVDWAQDLQYVPVLLDSLEERDKAKDTFQAYHILLALSKMTDQLAYELRKIVRNRLSAYKPFQHKDSPKPNSREILRAYIIKQIAKPMIVNRKVRPAPPWLNDPCKAGE